MNFNGLLKCNCICMRYLKVQPCISVIKFSNSTKSLLKLEYARHTCFVDHLLSTSKIRFKCNRKPIGANKNNHFNRVNSLLKHFSIDYVSSRYFSNQESEWENLLSSEKRNSIKDVPVKKENIYTIPNLLCCLRIAITPYIGYLIIHKDFNIALIVSLFAAFSDLADGYIARKWPSQQSALGSALDPLADKILVSVLAVSLTYVNIIPVVLTALFVGRDLLLIGAVFYVRYKTCPPPVTLKRYFDPTLVNAKLSPTKISKINTFLQITVIWASVASPVFGYTDHILLKSLWCLSALSTIMSGLSYVRRKDTVRILKDTDKQKNGDKK